MPAGGWTLGFWRECGGLDFGEALQGGYFYKLQERTPRARRPRGDATGVRAAEEGCWRGEGWGGRGCKPGKVQRCRGSLPPAQSLPEVPAWAGGPSSHVAISPPSFLSLLPAGVTATARTAGPEEMPAASQPLKPSLREAKISVTIHPFRVSGTWEVQRANYKPKELRPRPQSSEVSASPCQAPCATYRGPGESPGTWCLKCVRPNEDSPGPRHSHPASRGSAAAVRVPPQVTL